MAKILVVDDRPINREVLSLLLDENNHEVFEAEDGLQALQLAKETRPDLIITDIVMPRFDGVALVKALNKDPTLLNVPVIFYSASYKAAEAYRLAATSNVKYVLTKPCVPEIILGTIEGALDPNSTFFNNSDFHQSKCKSSKIKSGIVPLSVPTKKEKTIDQNLLLTNLIEIGLDMSIEHDVKKLIYIVCRGGRHFLNADYAGVILRKQNNPLQYDNFVLGSKDIFTHHEFAESMLTAVLKHIFINDKPHCLHSPIVEVEKIGLTELGLPFTSLLTLPLKTTRDVYGKIYFINKENPKFFTLSNQRYMMTLADKFSINYENLLLYQEIEQYTQKLEQEMAQRKQTEEKLRIYRNQMAETIRANSLGELASSLAHEINQPLAAINAYVKGCIKRIERESLEATSLNSENPSAGLSNTAASVFAASSTNNLTSKAEALQNKKEFTVEILKILNETAFQAERAGEIIHRLKNFVRKGELFFENVDINSFIKEVIQLAQQEIQNFPVQIKYQMKKKLPKLMLDKIQMQQVILNLVRNAIEAMAEANTLDPNIIIQVLKLDTDRVMIKIIDNGPGFLPHLENNLFELYFTTKAQGMGMGLAICRSIVEAHSGQISASLRPEGGSCFQFDLPVKKESSENFDWV